MNMDSLFQEYKDSLVAGLNQVDHDDLMSFISEIENMASLNQTLFIMGNGGSAATATHFVNDLFALNLKFPEFNLNVESLTENSSIVTALANDISYEEIFNLQLKVKAKSGDALLILSASGNSANLVKAAQWGKEHGYRIFSMTGFDGGEIKKLSDFSIHIETKKGEYERAEDLQLFINHFIRYYLQKKYS